MKQVIVFPRGQLSAEDRKAMRAVGIVAIEADDPSKVVVAVPQSAIVTGDDLLIAALAGVNCKTYDQNAATFAKTLADRIKAREAKGEAE